MLPAHPPDSGQAVARSWSPWILGVTCLFRHGALLRWLLLLPP